MQSTRRTSKHVHCDVDHNSSNDGQDDNALTIDVDIAALLASELKLPDHLTQCLQSFQMVYVHAIPVSETD